MSAGGGPSARAARRQTHAARPPAAPAGAPRPGSCARPAGRPGPEVRGAVCAPGAGRKGSVWGPGGSGAQLGLWPPALPARGARWPRPRGPLGHPAGRRRQVQGAPNAGCRAGGARAALACAGRLGGWAAGLGCACGRPALALPSFLPSFLVRRRPGEGCVASVFRSPNLRCEPGRPRISPCFSPSLSSYKNRR